MTGYISTRGRAPRLGFTETTLAGLASDGGLYVPESYPQLGSSEIFNMAHQPYLEIAHRVMIPFVTPDISSGDLIRLLQAAYKNFSHKDIAPLRKLEDDFYVLELFHGPTLAFKDIALQFLGQLFDHILSRRQEKVTIIGATSGDTGSAAIEAFRDSKNAQVFILHPHNRVSPVQRRQMTTVLSPNVFNVAVEGSFDDCQNIVKSLFNDKPFRNERRLSAVNSINWARIMAQVVYYVAAAAKAGGSASFAVPTGNFGNIYAGYMAKSMGAPVEKLIAASNSNDILHRFFEGGEMRMGVVVPTLSPSMDIQVSSNFERLLFDLYGRSGFAVNQTMDYFRDEGPFRLSAEVMGRVRGIFASGRQDDAATLETIKRIYHKYNYLVDPHTAVGLGVAEAFRKPGQPMIALATAHPAKFPDAVKKATGVMPELPAHLADLHERPEKYDVLSTDVAKIRQFMRERISV